MHRQKTKDKERRHLGASICSRVQCQDDTLPQCGRRSRCIPVQVYENQELLGFQKIIKNNNAVYLKIALIKAMIWLPVACCG